MVNPLNGIFGVFFLMICLGNWDGFLHCCSPTIPSFWKKQVGEQHSAVSRKRTLPPF